MAKILVIEDRPIDMKLTCFFLQKFGHSILQAVDAEAGLTLARKNQPDLILMDLQLPGTDGLTATTLLKQDSTTVAIPIIALTALAMKSDHDKSLAAGCDAYLAKPMHYKQLHAIVNQHLI